MESFSQRKGIKPIRSVQSDSMDEELRVGLWNVFEEIYWKETGIDKPFASGLSLFPGMHGKVYRLHKMLWTDCFKLSLDREHSRLDYIHEKIKEIFFQCEWYQAYDFIEFVANNYPDKSVSQGFIKSCNTVLEREMSAYRFTGGKVTEITSKTEISEIEEASQSPILTVQEHLRRALEHFSDRESPDYRNSMKESISAVESLCKLVIGDENATLGNALKEIERNSNVELHPALEQAFRKLYAYTGDADGIRHGLKDKPSVSSEDARFMLVACSAFINYLTAKASKAGVNLE